MPVRKVKGGYKWGNLERFTLQENKQRDKEELFMPVVINLIRKSNYEKVLVLHVQNKKLYWLWS